jgi:hypothetical protein
VLVAAAVATTPLVPMLVLRGMKHYAHAPIWPVVPIFSYEEARRRQ